MIGFVFSIVAMGIAALTQGYIRRRKNILFTVDCGRVRPIGPTGICQSYPRLWGRGGLEGLFTASAVQEIRRYKGDHHRRCFMGRCSCSACCVWRELCRGLPRRTLVRDAADDRICNLCRCLSFLFDDQNEKHHSRLYLPRSNQRPARSTAFYLRIKLQRLVRPKIIRGHWNVRLFGHWNCTNALHKEQR